MQIHQIKRKYKNTKRMTVGRGGKRGKTSGRGTKGQKARAGRKIRPEIRDVIKRIPKMRGRGKNSNLSIQTKPVVINLNTLEKIFKSGDIVSRSTLVEKGVVSSRKGKIPTIKILGTGDLTKKLTLKDVLVSGSVKEKVVKAGGSIS